MNVDGLIIGLGNPGPRYSMNRHNAGFMVVDAILRGPGATAMKTKGKYELFKGELPGIRGAFLLVKPQTFMNLSGEAVRHVLDYYSIDQDKLIVVHDELDVPLGRLRFKRDGGVAGHNGLASIVLHLGSRDFHRLRVGIGRPQGRQDVKDWVLGDFSPQERVIVEKVALAAVEGLAVFFGQGPVAAMQHTHPWTFPLEAQPDVD